MSRTRRRTGERRNIRGREGFNFHWHVTGYTFGWTVDNPGLRAQGNADGDSVASWPNEGFLANAVPMTASGAERPLYRPTGMGGGPCLEFDGSNDKMITADLTDLPRPFYLLFTGQMIGSGDATRHALFAASQTGNDMCVGQDTADRFFVRDDSDLTTSTASDDLVRTFVARFGATGVDNDLLVVSGVTVSDSDKPDQANADFLSLGAASTWHTNMRVGAFYYFATNGGDPRAASWFDAYNVEATARWGAEAWV